MKFIGLFVALIVLIASFVSQTQANGWGLGGKFVSSIALNVNWMTIIFSLPKGYRGGYGGGYGRGYGGSRLVGGYGGHRSYGGYGGLRSYGGGYRKCSFYFPLDRHHSDHPCNKYWDTVASKLDLLSMSTVTFDLWSYILINIISCSGGVSVGRSSYGHGLGGYGGAVRGYGLGGGLRGYRT